MRPHTPIRSTSLIVLTLACTAIAYAQGPQRTFVSADPGVADNAACSRTQPCRNFAAAISAVAAGGEVVALTSGGYGPLTINKSVTLTGPTGVHVAITSQTAGQSAITVSAADTDTVVLRGLTLTGLGGQYGINVTSVGVLHVESCVISDFALDGIHVSLAADGGRILIKDTIVRNNGFHGIVITTSAGTVRASIDNCRAERNARTAFFASNRSRVTVSRSVASGNGVGFRARSDAIGVTAEMNCDECVASVNDFGFLADPSAGPATIRVSRSTATHNSIGFSIAGAGVFESLANNLVRGNVTDTDGTITVIPAQ